MAINNLNSGQWEFRDDIFGHFISVCKVVWNDL